MRRIITAVWFAIATQAAAQEDAGQVMLDAIVDNCLPKLTGDRQLGIDGLRPTEAELAAALLPGGRGKVWRTAAPGVVVLDPRAEFACQVIGEEVPFDTFSAALRDWLDGDGAEFTRDGNLPLTARNPAGVYLVTRTEDREYILIHVAPVPNGRLSALAIRMPNNSATRRYLRR